MPKSLGPSSERSMADAQSDSDEFELELSVPSRKSAATILCDESDEQGSDVDLPDDDPSRPHKCKICKKGFCRAGDRNTHQKSVHSERRPWRCSECNKRFKLKKEAVRHQTLHSGNPKPFLCPVCKKTFNQKVAAKSDLKRIHHIELLDIPKITISTPSIVADNKQGGEHPVKTKKHSTKHIKPKKIPEPAPLSKLPPGRIKSTPTSGQKRKRAPSPSLDPEEDSGIDLPSKSSSTRKNVNKKRKPSISSSDHDSGFDEDFDSPTRRSSQSNSSNDGAVHEYDFDFDGEEAMKVGCE